LIIYADIDAIIDAITPLFRHYYAIDTPPAIDIDYAIDAIDDISLFHLPLRFHY
jgi:hypothetical protein